MKLNLNLSNKLYRIIFTVFAIIFVGIGTYLAIKWAQGYRFNISEQSLEANGLLVVNSKPKGAFVIINDDIKTATNDTLHLIPGEYDVKIEKDGYSPWHKKLQIEKELVTQVNAMLFPTVPNLSALTVNGAYDLHPSPDGHKIAFKVATSSATTKQGIWVINLINNPLSFSNNAIQIVKDTPELKFSQTKIFWGPDSNQIIAYVDANHIYTLKSNTLNSNPILNNYITMPQQLMEWENQISYDLNEKLAKLPPQMQKIATKSATLLYFSPNDEKLLYLATQSATIKDHLIPPLPASNTQPQTRTLKPGDLYVYDIKEDKNFKIADQQISQEELERTINTFNLPIVSPKQNTIPSPTPYILFKKNKLAVIDRLRRLEQHYSAIYTDLGYQWHPSSEHLIHVYDNKISIVEYDSTNETTIYSGSFIENFAYPWPNGDKLIISTSLNQDGLVPQNLYGISIK